MILELNAQRWLSVAVSSALGLFASVGMCFRGVGALAIGLMMMLPAHVSDAAIITNNDSVTRVLKLAERVPSVPSHDADTPSPSSATGADANTPEVRSRALPRAGVVTEGQSSSANPPSSAAAESAREYQLKPGTTLRDICKFGCIIRIDDDVNKDFILDGTEQVSIENGLLYFDGEITKPAPAKKK